MFVLEQGIILNKDQVFYKADDNNIYEIKNPRGCYADFHGPKIFKNVHHVGRFCREIDCQSTYRDKKTGIVFTLFRV